MAIDNYVFTFVDQKQEPFSDDVWVQKQFLNTFPEQ